jgi:hypothetical protein
MRLSFLLLVVAATTLVTAHAAPAHGKTTTSLNQIQDESGGNKRFLRKYAAEDTAEDTTEDDDDDDDDDEEERGFLSFGTSNVVKHAGRSKKLDKKLDQMLDDSAFMKQVFKKWEGKYKAGDIYVRLKVNKDGKYAEIYNAYESFLQRGAGMYHMTG